MLLLLVIAYKTDVSNLTVIPQNHLFVHSLQIIIDAIEIFLQLLLF